MQAIAIEQNNLSNQSHGFSNTSSSTYESGGDKQHKLPPTFIIASLNGMAPTAQACLHPNCNGQLQQKSSNPENTSDNKNRVLQNPKHTHPHL